MIRWYAIHSRGLRHVAQRSSADGNRLQARTDGMLEDVAVPLHRPIPPSDARAHQAGVPAPLLGASSERDFHVEFPAYEPVQLATSRRAGVHHDAERCTLEDRFLIVRGNLHTYRIHLISGNIFMEPGEKYLCIVFDTKLHAKQEELFFLPFDGDPLFSLILSKAFLLAEDSKITDPSILSQFQRG